MTPGEKGWSGGVMMMDTGGLFYSSVCFGLNLKFFVVKRFEEDKREREAAADLQSLRQSQAEV